MPILSATEIKSHRVDFVIIGGGTAGLALAARLTEDPSVTVLVIEAGTYHGSEPIIDIPGYIGRGIINPKFDWQFQSVPQKHAGNNVVFQPRGKGLGGSSHANFLGMFRPSKAELDALEALGNKGWNWDSLLQYMKKSEAFIPVPISEENAHLFAINPDLSLHGTEGPIKKSYPKEWSRLHENLFKSVEDLGILKATETAGGRNIGAMSALMSVDPVTAKRSYATSGYLEPNLNRKNLLALIDAQVTKVIFEEQAGLQRAVGVEFVKDGSLDSIMGIEKDCIVAAGSFQTPQILELSGIGRQDVLNKFGIETIINLPGVGENLQDHVGIFTIAEVDTPDTTFNDLLDPTLAKEHEELYREKKAGMLAQIPSSAYIFLSAHNLGSDEDVLSWEKQMHVQCTESLARADPSLRSGLEKQYAVQRDLFSDKEQVQAEIINLVGHMMLPYAQPVPGKKYSSFFCAVMHPLSRGSVHITTSDPLAPPAIDPNYFANEADLDIVVNSIELALKINATPPLSTQVIRIHSPSKDVLEKGKEGLREYVRAGCWPVYHPVGTASMLPKEDGGVVDSSLKVYGTSNLRVVDLSILPMEVSGHTQALAYAIGEKAADILKGQS
ncbi:GMC oxidoreductase [Schizopora paradoxa]|uniref:GMC oxidoreductase n=1 Tax=Schizopora paradoxa TaxID=27342 RepID=A0A0H2S5F7_9AGAM|nr:GMC oxidoreductase [Schizopora paradoxa]